MAIVRDCRTARGGGEERWRTGRDGSAALRQLRSLHFCVRLRSAPAARRWRRRFTAGSPTMMTPARPSLFHNISRTVPTTRSCSTTLPACSVDCMNPTAAHRCSSMPSKPGSAISATCGAIRTFGRCTIIRSIRRSFTPAMPPIRCSLNARSKRGVSAPLHPPIGSSPTNACASITSPPWMTLSSRPYADPCTIRPSFSGECCSAIRRSITSSSRCSMLRMP